MLATRQGQNYDQHTNSHKALGTIPLRNKKLRGIVEADYVRFPCLHPPLDRNQGTADIDHGVKGYHRIDSSAATDWGLKLQHSIYNAPCGRNRTFTHHVIYNVPLARGVTPMLALQSCCEKMSSVLNAVAAWEPWLWTHKDRRLCVYVTWNW